jgi:acylphosphatase
MKRLEASVFGQVQGVSFRVATRRIAQSLGLRGWVRNEMDGSVRVVAEGDEPALQRFLAFLHEGPPAARVLRVDSQWSEASRAFSSFQVRM